MKCLFKNTLGMQNFWETHSSRANSAQAKTVKISCCTLGVFFHKNLISFALNEPWILLIHIAFTQLWSQRQMLLIFQLSRTEMNKSHQVANQVVVLSCLMNTFTMEIIIKCLKNDSVFYIVWKKISFIRFVFRNGRTDARRQRGPLAVGPSRGREVRRYIYDIIRNDHSRFIRFLDFHKTVLTLKYYYNMIDHLARFTDLFKFSNE